MKDFMNITILCKEKDEKKMFQLQIANNTRKKHPLLLYHRWFFFFISTFQLEFQIETSDMHSSEAGIPG
jgi:hypothetical protein